MGKVDREITLVEHLHELRRRIIIALLSVLFCSAVSFSFASRILRLLKRPAGGLVDKLAFFTPTEAITSYIKIAIFAGIILAAPIVLYQIWAFCLPAIKPELRKAILKFLFASTVFFGMGIAFSYFVLLPCALKFCLSFESSDLVPVISIGKYVSFVTMLLLGSGAVFQMPVIAWALARLKIISSGFLRKSRKFAALGIFIAAAIITPTPDAVNMLILALPMLLLYEISVIIVRCTEALSKK